MTQVRPPEVNDRAFAAVQTKVQVLVGLFGVWHLTRLHDDFGGDLLCARILGEIAHHNIAAIVASGELALEYPAEHLYANGQLLPCNAYSIACACKLPRETVRRKIDKLVKRGWLARNEKGELFVTSVPAEHFRPFNLEFVNRVLDLADRLRAVLAEAPVEKRLIGGHDAQQGHRLHSRGVDRQLRSASR